MIVSLFLCLSALLADAQTLSSSNHALGEVGAWSIVKIGSSDQRMYSVAVGDGRNDGVMRVYGGNEDNHVYEFSCSDDAWTKGDISQINCGFGISSVAIGNGRYDHVNRVYVAKNSICGISYVGEGEYTYAGAQWNGYSFDFGDFNFSHDIGWSAVGLGAARNDSVSRVYFGGGIYWGDIVEFTYDAGKFQGDIVGSFPNGSAIHGMAVGVGRNDGYARIYAASLNGNLYECSYSDSSWLVDTVSVVPSKLLFVTIGSGRNDNVSRVYVASGDGHIYELSSHAGNWTKVDVGYGGQAMEGVVLGSLKNDGITRVYGANADGHIYEFTYSENSWKGTDIGTAETALWGLAIGAVRGDGKNRIYGAGDDGSVYEFSYANSPAPTPASPANGSTGISTNPTLTWTAPPGASSYRLQVSTDSNFVSTTFDTSGLTSASDNITGLSNSRKYYWRVNATNASGTSAWSAVWNFTTSSADVPVIDNVTFSGSLGSGLNITVKGSGFADASKLMPYTGDLPYFLFKDITASFQAGYTDLKSTVNAVTVKYLSWTSNEIVTGGFAGLYGIGGKVSPGDQNINYCLEQEFRTSGNMERQRATQSCARSAESGLTVKRLDWSGNQSCVDMECLLWSDELQITGVNRFDIRRNSI